MILEIKGLNNAHEWLFGDPRLCIHSRFVILGIDSLRVVSRKLE